MELQDKLRAIQNQLLLNGTDDLQERKAKRELDRLLWVVAHPGAFVLGHLAAELGHTQGMLFEAGVAGPAEYEVIAAAARLQDACSRASVSDIRDGSRQ